MDRGMWIVIMAVFALFVAGVVGGIYLDVAGDIRPCQLFNYALGPLQSLAENLGGDIPCPFNEGG